MERDELVAIFNDRENLKPINNGSFNVVYELSPGFVVKFSLNPGQFCDDVTTWDYMQWCHLRLLKFGARSPEMVGFPIILGVINEVGMRMAVMRRCEQFVPFTATDGTLHGASYMIDKHASKALETLIDVFCVSRWELDLHSGNIMWDKVRDQLVLTDPFAGNFFSSDKINVQPKAPKVKMPKPPKVKRTALWMRAALRQLYQYNC